MITQLRSLPETSTKNANQSFFSRFDDLVKELCESPDENSLGSDALHPLIISCIATQPDVKNMTEMAKMVLLDLCNKASQLDFLRFADKLSHQLVIREQGVIRYAHRVSS